jgi:hypothetical protein
MKKVRRAGGYASNIVTGSLAPVSKGLKTTLGG